MSLIDMMLSGLLKQPSVIDIITTEDTIYVITDGNSKKDLPLIVSDLRIEVVQTKDLLYHKELKQILTGESVRRNKSVKKGTSKKRFEKYILYEYDVSKLEPSKKQKFSHELNGTGGRKSKIDSLNGTRMGKGVLLVPKQGQAELELFLNDYGVVYTNKKILMEEGL